MPSDGPRFGSVLITICRDVPDIAGGARDRAGGRPHGGIGAGLSRGPPDQGRLEKPARVATIEEVERGHILAVLEATGWRVSGNGARPRSSAFRPPPSSPG